MEAADSAENQIVDDRSIEDRITGLKQNLSELKALKVIVNEDPDKLLNRINIPADMPTLFLDVNGLQETEMDYRMAI